MLIYIFKARFSDSEFLLPVIFLSDTRDNVYSSNGCELGLYFLFNKPFKVRVCGWVCGCMNTHSQEERKIQTKGPPGVQTFRKLSEIAKADTLALPSAHRQALGQRCETQILQDVFFPAQGWFTLLSSSVNTVGSCLPTKI